jgi:predicted DNA-binding transcriptional regulator AlpA
MKPYQLQQCADNKTLSPTGLMKLPQVLAVFPVSRSTWYAGIKSGIYPHALKLGQRSSAWSVESIRELIERVATESKGVSK